VRRSEEDVAERVDEEREAIEGIESEVVADRECEWDSR